MSAAARLRWLVPAGLVLAVLVAHAPAFDAGFAFDDPAAVVDNPVVTGEAPPARAFTGNFWGDRPGFEHLASWRPVTLWTLRADHGVADGAAWPFHATNVGLHALACLLAWAVAGRLGASPWLAAAAGLAVAMHPVFAEAVASVVGRGDLLAAAATLAALLFWGPRPALALGFLAVGLLSKETAVLGAAALGLQALVARAWLRAGAVAAVVGAWYAARALAVGQLGGEITAYDNPVAGLDGGERLSAGLGAVGRMLGWVALPQQVAPDYGLGVELAGPGGVHAIVGAVALAGLTALLVWAVRRRLWLAIAGLTLALSGLVLASNLLFLLPTPLAGRLAYLPACGLVLAVAGLGYAAPRAVAAGLAGLALVGLPATWATDRAWADDRALFEHGVEVEPTSVRARVNLAAALLEAGEPAAAREHLEVALAVAPEHPSALSNLAVLLDREGRLEEARALAARAAAGERRPGRAHANLCAMRLRASARDVAAAGEALEVCRRAAAGMPRAPEVQANLGRALARTGDRQGAEQAFRAALALDPTSDGVLGHWIGFLVETGRVPDALALQRDLLARAPEDPERRRNFVALAFLAADGARRADRPHEVCALVREAVIVSGRVPAVVTRAEALCPGSGAIPGR